APFHWNGQFATLGDFMNLTITERMGGAAPTPAEVSQLTAFLDALPAPDSPLRGAALSPAAVRGAAVFTSAGCNNCHGGDALTLNNFANVGTLVASGTHRDDASALPSGFNTPSLLGISRSAPYLHSGAAVSLRDRIERDRQSGN